MKMKSDGNRTQSRRSSQHENRNKIFEAGDSFATKRKRRKKAIKELDENKLNCFNLGSRNKSRVGFIVLAIFGLIRTKARVDIILLVSGLNIFIPS